MGRVGVGSLQKSADGYFFLCPKIKLSAMSSAEERRFLDSDMWLNGLKYDVILA